MYIWLNSADNLQVAGIQWKYWKAAAVFSSMQSIPYHYQGTGRQWVWHNRIPSQPTESIPGGILLGSVYYLACQTNIVFQLTVQHYSHQGSSIFTNWHHFKSPVGVQLSQLTIGQNGPFVFTVRIISLCTLKQKKCQFNQFNKFTFSQLQNGSFKPHMHGIQTDPCHTDTHSLNSLL